MSVGLDPSRILQTGFGFWGSKVLLTAVELGVFTELDDKGMTGEALGKKLGLHPRGIWDFFDCLVALGFRANQKRSRSDRESTLGTPAVFCIKKDSEQVLATAQIRVY